MCHAIYARAKPPDNSGGFAVTDFTYRLAGARKELSGVDPL